MKTRVEAQRLQEMTPIPVDNSPRTPDPCTRLLQERTCLFYGVFQKKPKDMSQSPWPEDLYAVARLDWCRSMDTPEGGPVAQLVCNNLARQCGSFTNATRDHQRIARTAPQLQELLKAPEFEQWKGKCPVVQAEGVCGLGGARSYREELWNAFAQPRQDAIYSKIAGLKRMPSQAPEGEDFAEVGQEAMFADALNPERTIAMAVARRNADPQRVINDYQVRALPFI